MEQLVSVIPKTSPLRIDVMVGRDFICQLTFPCQVGYKYPMNDLMAFARMKKPSLNGKAFELIPTDQPVFR